MVITEEMLKGKYVTDWTYKAMHECNYVGKEVKDIIEDYCLPELACNLMFEVELPDEDIALLKKCAMVDPGSSGVYKSCYVSKSTNVAGSHHVTNSKSVLNSTRVTNSNFVMDSTDVKDSECVYNLSGHISKSYFVYDGYNIKHSWVVVTSDDVKNSFFVFGASSANDAIFCSSIIKDRVQDFNHCIFCTVGGGGYKILNREVSEEDFISVHSSIFAIMKKYLQDNKAEFEDRVIGRMNEGKQLLSWDVFSFFNNANMWRRVLSELPFKPTKEEYMILYNMTMLPFFLKMGD